MSSSRYDHPIPATGTACAPAPRSVRLEALLFGHGYSERQPGGRQQLERAVGNEFAGFLLSMLGVGAR